MEQKGCGLDAADIPEGGADGNHRDLLAGADRDRGSAGGYPAGDQLPAVRPAGGRAGGGERHGAGADASGGRREQLQDGVLRRHRAQLLPLVHAGGGRRHPVPRRQRLPDPPLFSG